MESHNKERKSNRVLLLIYDLLAYYFVTFLFVQFTKNRLADIGQIFWILNGIALPVLLTASRLLFGVYKQIWRIPSVISFARLIVADIVAGGIFVGIIMIIRTNNPQFMYLGGVELFVFLAINVLTQICCRLIYFYLFLFAKKEGKFSCLVRVIISHLGFVDFDSKEEGAILKLVLTSEEKALEPINDVMAVFYRFNVQGHISKVIPINTGYINRTYKIETISEHDHRHVYVLQRINTKVFPNVDKLMDNYAFVIKHLNERLATGEMKEVSSVLELKNTLDGKKYLKDFGGCYRVLKCIENVYALDIPDCTNTFHNAGLAFGEFIKLMGDVNPSDIFEVISNFHNTQSRYLDLEKTISLNPVGRLEETQKEVQFVRDHQYIFNIISSRLTSGQLPLRVCHNDTNLNNILFDNKTQKAVAIIDLDTVMPSTPLYDFGDSMRIGTNTAKDDEKDLSKVGCNLDMYQAYASGWLKSCGAILTEEELNLLPYACLVITSEDGIRFLKDHLDGDTYYNIFYPGQNLDRSRTQLALVADMERKLPEIKRILKDIYVELGLKGDPYKYQFEKNI